MTTAHRPTWKAAVGASSEASWNTGGAPASASSVLDAASHTRLKLRTGRQALLGSADERVATSLRKLEEAEAKLRSLTYAGPLRPVDGSAEEEGRRRLLRATAEVDEERLKLNYDDADHEAGSVNGGGWSDLDDDPGDGAGSDTESESDADASDDEDEEAALRAELAKIRAERRTAEEKREAEEREKESAAMEEAALVGNPLLGTADGTVAGKKKRRWNEDVVFRNQAKGEPERDPKRFINDTIRNDFHKRFLDKFMR